MTERGFASAVALTAVVFAAVAATDLSLPDSVPALLAFGVPNLVFGAVRDLHRRSAAT